MKKQSLNALAASYRADLLYYIERAKLGKCPPHWQAYCFGEIAAARGTDAYPEDGDALLDELHRLVDTVPQITNREENVAEVAAYRGQMLFYFDRDYYTLAELVRLPGREKYSACTADAASGTAGAAHPASRAAPAKRIANLRIPNAPNPTFKLSKKPCRGEHCSPVPVCLARKLSQKMRCCGKLAGDQWSPLHTQ